MHRILRDCNIHSLSEWSLNVFFTKHCVPDGPLDRLLVVFLNIDYLEQPFMTGVNVSIEATA